MFVGIVTLIMSAICEFHSIAQLDMILGRFVWTANVDNINFYNWLNSLHLVFYKDYPWIDSIFTALYNGKVGGAYDFFLGMNAMGWALGLIGIFFIMLGVMMIYRKQLQTLRKSLSLKEDGRVFEEP